MRALGYSLKGLFDKAVADYDKAIGSTPISPPRSTTARGPTSSSAARSRAPATSSARCELAPGNPYALDTRAHIHQSTATRQRALADYELAMRYGGETIVKLYQCGLRSQSLYFGALDGVYSSDVKRALHVCINRKGCDPLPGDEDCRPSVS